MAPVINKLLEKLSVEELRDVIKNHHRRDEITIHIGKQIKNKYEVSKIGDLVILGVPASEWKRLIIDALVLFEKPKPPSRHRKES